MIMNVKLKIVLIFLMFFLIPINEGSSITAPDGLNYKVEVGDTAEYIMTKFNSSSTTAVTVINGNKVISYTKHVGLTQKVIISSISNTINANVYFENQTDSINYKINEAPVMVIPIPGNASDFNFDAYSQLANWPYKNYSIDSDNITFYDKVYIKFGVYDLKTGWLLKQYFLGNDSKTTVYEEEWTLSSYKPSTLATETNDLLDSSTNNSINSLSIELSSVVAVVILASLNKIYRKKY